MTVEEIGHILLIRHGETPATLNRKYEGSGNSSLTATGQEQARNLSRILEPVNIYAVYSSPKRRCLQTAEAIAEPHSLAAQVAPGLEEVDFGSWEGLTFTKIQQKHPDMLSKWIDDPVHVRPPSGESLEEMANRVFQCFDRICSIHLGDQIIAIVTHGGPIRALLSRTDRGDLSGFWEYSVPPCAVHCISNVRR
ncbi:MAG TPA: histidine phosphatase family protein [Firmicutes bacterium]|nr:histidine phosphatase family protein [Candidatus Fermentithermobacillaceae bacterium]